MAGGPGASVTGMRPPRTAAHDPILYACGGLMLFAFALHGWRAPAEGSGWFLGLLGIAAAGYLAAVARVAAGRLPSRRALAICLTLAALARASLIPSAPPAPEQDVYRYLWDGRVQRLGYNPYAIVPADPSVAHLHTPQTRQMNHPDLPTIYPPGAQWLFRLVASVHESVPAVRAALVLCEIPLMLLLLRWLVASGRPPAWILSYAWNPLVILEVARNAHIDVLGVMWLVASLRLLLMQWRMLAAVTFAMAIAVKFLPLVLIPLYWSRVRARDAAAGAVVLAALYLPFMGDTWLPVGSLGDFIDRFRFNAPVFGALEGFVPPRLAAGLAVAAGLAAAAALRKRDPREPGVWAWPMAAALLCAPVIYPWYLLWLAPFLVSGATRPLLIWSISILPVYLVWHVEAWREIWTVPAPVLGVQFGAVAASALLALRAPRGPARTGAIPPPEVRR